MVIFNGRLQIFYVDLVNKVILEVKFVIDKLIEGISGLGEVGVFRRNLFFVCYFQKIVLGGFRIYEIIMYFDMKGCY